MRFVSPIPFHAISEETNRDSYGIPTNFYITVSDFVIFDSGEWETRSSTRGRATTARKIRPSR